jgi:hypothetical protein
MRKRCNQQNKPAYLRNVSIRHATCTVVKYLSWFRFFSLFWDQLGLVTVFISDMTSHREKCNDDKSSRLIERTYTNQYFTKHYEQEKISLVMMKNKNWKLTEFFVVSIFGEYMPALYLFSTVFHQSKNFICSLSSKCLIHYTYLTKSL